MPSFDWQRKRSTSFGKVWVPVAEVQFRAVNGVFKPVLMQIGSGAVVSLMRRSMAEEIGLRLEAGRRITLSTVGGSTTQAFVHELTLRFGASGSESMVPVAVADSETVPNLLGRQGVFEVFHIHFDPVAHRTRIENSSAA